MSRIPPVAPPQHLQTITLPDATVLLNLKTGQVDMLIGPAHRIWKALTTGHGQLPLARTLDVDDETAETVLSHLLDHALLSTVDAADAADVWPTPVEVPIPPASWGSNEAPARLTTPATNSWRWRALGAVALLITLTLRCLGRPTRRFARMLALPRLASRWATRPAVLSDAEQATRAVRSVARAVPARVACLEESIAAVLALALTGQQVGWCHGVVADPIQFHAWIEVRGQPVDEPPSTSLFTPVLRIPGPATREREPGTWKNR